MLKAAADRLPDEAGDLKAVTLLRLAAVEGSAKRFKDALRIDIEAAPLFQKSTNHAHQGKFHNQFGFVPRNLSTAEKRSDYIDRALIEYIAASYHFDRAQALFTSFEDTARLAGVDETRAKVLLAEGGIHEAERLVRSAVQVLERGGEQSLLAEALTTHGIALARMNSHHLAHQTLRRAIEVAQNVDDLEAAGLAALTVLKDLAEHLPAQDLSATYDRAVELLSNSQNQEVKNRLLATSRRVLFLISSLPSPPTWKGFDFYDAVLRFEARLIERALREAGGAVARHRAPESGFHVAHGASQEPRTPADAGRAAQKQPHVSRRGELPRHTHRVRPDEPPIAKAVQVALDGEGWSVETCADGAAALEKLESGARYDVLIFDNRLPGTNGIELIGRARALAHRQQTPIIMFSGEEIEMEARRAGANAFLRKPGDLSLIAETVARLLARKRGREERDSSPSSL